MENGVKLNVKRFRYQLTKVTFKTTLATFHYTNNYAVQIKLIKKLDYLSKQYDIEDFVGSG